MERREFVKLVPLTALGAGLAAHSANAQDASDTSREGSADFRWISRRQKSSRLVEGYVDNRHARSRTRRQGDGSEGHLHRRFEGRRHGRRVPRRTR